MRRIFPNNQASLEPFEVVAPENSIVNAPHPAPVAVRHIVGHFVPDTLYDALDKIVPGVVPAEGAGCLCNFQVSLRPREAATAPNHARRSEVLVFNSGGSGARPEHAGPVIIWRKELRQNSGGAGRTRGGLGQYMEVGAMERHEFDFQAMFDRALQPARGRRGGGNGAPTTIAQDDGTPMRVKGKQFVPHGRRVMMAFPGGAGYGNPKDRDRSLVMRDLARGYIKADTAARDYGLSDQEIAAVENAVRSGEPV